ncbi:MAG: universal stress protein [Nitrospiria bacterium]
MIQSTRKGKIPDFEIKRILVPTDFSECSRKALDFACSLAKNYQSKVLILHVIEASVYSLDSSLIPPGDPFGLRQKLSEMVDQAVSLLEEKGIPAEGECITGVPAIEIIRAVFDKQADLIVMGTHGRTGLAHILLGSTAERVIQRAQCPVMTIKADKKAAEANVKDINLEEKRRAVKELVPPIDKTTYCHLCGQPANDIICDACKVRVQTEAFDMKQRVEKEGRIDSGRR